MADIDFSHVNLQYLICARDLARSYPERAALLLGATDDLVRLLAELDPATLVGGDRDQGAAAGAPPGALVVAPSLHGVPSWTSRRSFGPFSTRRV